jgi:integrase
MHEAIWSAPCSEDPDVSLRLRLVRGVSRLNAAPGRVPHRQQCAAAGERWTEHDLVFTSATGARMDAGGIRLALKRHLRQAGLLELRFHNLRHTAATLALGEGVHPKVVSEMLGHATIAITLDVNFRFAPAMHQSLSAMMDRVLSEPKSIAVRTAVKRRPQLPGPPD